MVKSDPFVTIIHILTQISGIVDESCTLVAVAAKLEVIPSNNCVILQSRQLCRLSIDKYYQNQIQISSDREQQVCHTSITKTDFELFLFLVDNIMWQVIKIYIFNIIFEFNIVKVIT